MASGSHLLVKLLLYHFVRLHIEDYYWELDNFVRHPLVLVIADCIQVCDEKLVKTATLTHAFEWEHELRVQL